MRSSNLDGECLKCGKVWTNVPANQIFTRCDKCQDDIFWYDPSEEEDRVPQRQRAHRDDDWA